MALSLLIPAGTAAPAQAASGFWQIRTSNNLCLARYGIDPYGNWSLSQVPCATWLNPSSESQFFELLPVGPGVYGFRYNIRVLRSYVPKNQCVDVPGWSTRPGEQMIFWHCRYEYANQAWEWEYQYDGTWKIISAHSFMCLDVPHSSSRWYLQIQQVGCNSHPAQRFHLTPSR